MRPEGQGSRTMCNMLAWVDETVVKPMPRALLAAAAAERQACSPQPR